jgi:hypothetical protein
MNHRRGFVRVIIFVQVFFISHGVSAPSSHTPYTFSDLLVYVAKTGETLFYNDMQVILKKLHFENCSLTDRKQDCSRVRNLTGHLILEGIRNLHMSSHTSECELAKSSDSIISSLTSAYVCVVAEEPIIKRLS